MFQFSVPFFVEIGSSTFFASATQAFHLPSSIRTRTGTSNVVAVSSPLMRLGSSGSATSSFAG